jgi:ABC-type antimicrobial peptide transport system permease subunit
LLDKIRPEQVGLVIQPVKADGLAAATGSTDFSSLFIGFSLFLIISAILLVGLLFKLGVEQRASEIGILLTTGYPISTVRRRFMKEGGLIVGIGGLIGLGGGVVYAWLLMAGLRTWWLAAVGTPFLSLHINPLSLVLGYLIALIVVLFSIGWTVRQFGKVPVPALIAGGAGAGGFSNQSSMVRTRTPILAFASLGIALGLTIFALVSETTASVGLFFGSGVLVLIAGLAFFSIWLRSGGRAANQSRVVITAQMGIKNSGRHPGRSMLCAALVGCACFVIVAVGANRHVERKQEGIPQKESGTGGFALVAESDIPLHHDLNSQDGRFELGFSESDSVATADTDIFPFRLLPGEDASCLNLYRPQKPRILGASHGFIRRGGFQFQGTTTAKENPWELLQDELEPGVIPAIGDYNSAQWILHLGLGDDLSIQNESGGQLKLRLVGVLQSSIFQSELLISEANFKKHFPGQSGYAYFLIQTPSIADSAAFSESTEHIGHTLERALDDYGLDVASTTEKLASYRAVENTYLSTFQTLGGLGLLLGTLGLGIVLLRNVIERSGELATLRAFGFRRAILSLMLLWENGFLLLIGILIGTVSALIAVAPHLTTPGVQVPWSSLMMTLVSVFLVGIIASAIAVYFALRRPLLPALKHDA